MLVFREGDTHGGHFGPAGVISFSMKQGVKGRDQSRNGKRGNKYGDVFEGKAPDLD